MTRPDLGRLLHGYFENHLKAQKGLRPATIRSYRDTLVLFLKFVAEDRRCKLTRVVAADLTVARVRAFLEHLEQQRHNHIRTRNQRLTALKAFFDWVAGQVPEIWSEAEQVVAIPAKRVPPARASYLERDEVEALFADLPVSGALVRRDRALLLFLYNTGARVQEVADLRVGNLDLGRKRVHLHGKGDKWRVCPLWDETIDLLRALIVGAEQNGPVFMSQRGQALTRFGIYKIVRRHTRDLDLHRHDAAPIVSPHQIRHSTAVHLLESGVEPNVIRNWLGHVSLTTTNHYAEITVAMKEKALASSSAPLHADEGARNHHRWKDDPSLLNWLKSL